MKKDLGKFAAAAVIYIAFAVYLYQPYFENFKALQFRDIFVVNVSVASLGAFLLSRRWVPEFSGSFFAGAVYGFGPFVLGLAKFHPSAGVLAAAIPWFFCLAAFGPKGRWKWIRLLLLILPFLAIILFFEISAYYRLFAVPIPPFHLSDLMGLLAPFVMVNKSITLVGFYHVPIVALLIGFAMLLAARRFGIMFIFAVGTILAFCNSIFNVSPMMWLTIPVLCCSIIIGAGFQALASASSADRKWVLAGVIVMLALAVIVLLLATKCQFAFAGMGMKYAELLLYTAEMYLLGAVAAGVLFFMAALNLRLHWLRWIILSAAAAVDIFLGARFIVDNIF